MIANRRSILAGFAVVAALPAAAIAQQQSAARGEELPPSPIWPPVSPRTAKEFSMGVIGPAELSRVTSQLGVERGTNAHVKQFAGFELTEAIAVTTVLKELGTPVPEMNQKAQATLDKIKNASKGSAFDRAYIMFQVENHEFLRALAETYLSSAPSTSDTMEMQGRHLATLALATFKEHVILTTEIWSLLKT